MRLAVLLSVAAVGCSAETALVEEPPTAIDKGGKCGPDISFVNVPNGVVSTAEIATEVGYQYLHGLYPRSQLRPLSAEIEDGVWKVSGYFPKGDIGGTGHAWICRSNGRVLRIWFEQ